VEKIEELEALIKHHKALYYQGRPEIKDSEYDKLEEKLRKIDPENSTLEIVGSTQTGNKVQHKTKMLSLNKTYKADDLEKWVEGRPVVSTLKIDGVSCSIEYEDGKLLIAKTRGDGSFGEDITEKVKWISTVPKTISSKNKLEVRGELFCDEKNFYLLSEEMVIIGQEKPTSQRNIVAGLISRKESIELCRYIEFRAFDLIDDKQPLKYELEKEKILSSYGFTPEEFKLHKNFSSLKKELNYAAEFMSTGEYQIDGLVISLNEIALHEELGATAHHPRFKIAFKYQGDTKKTIINEIKWSVSRNGILTPVAEVEPVELSGAKISRVTLHNYGMVKQYELKTGDEIEIVRSGEVIPKFLSVSKYGNGKFSVPSECPSCNEKTETVDIRIICVNENCPGKNKESILNFIQKIGIDDLSSKRLDEMILKGVVNKIEDLYSIKKGQLLELDKVKDKLEEKLLLNIEKSKAVDFTTFLSALGIQGGAYNKCEKVVSSGFNTIDKILKIKLEDLMNIDGFAEKSSVEFLSSIHEKEKLIKGLGKLGFKFEAPKEIAGTLSGKKIAITGSLSEKRTLVEAKIRSIGGTVVSSISKNTDILLTNQQTSASSKFKKATELGIEIISEEDLNSLL
jgi:DNA ligase (NAD+)